MNKFIRILIGFILGTIFTLVLLYLGLISAGAGGGVYLPMFLGMGLFGIGFYSWPLIGAMLALSNSKEVKMISFILIFLNLLGSIYLLIRYSSIAAEVSELRPSSLIGFLWYVLGIFIVWMWPFRSLPGIDEPPRL